VLSKAKGALRREGCQMLEAPGARLDKTRRNAINSNKIYV